MPPATPCKTPRPLTPRCPACDGTLVRTARRPIDRFRSTFWSPVHRFRCDCFTCQWEGNLPAPRGRTVSRKLVSAVDALTQNDDAALPWTFVVSTSLALAGFIVVMSVAFDTMTLDHTLSLQDFSSESLTSAPAVLPSLQPTGATAPTVAAR